MVPIPRRRSREECTIEGAELVGVGEGEGKGRAGKGNWQKLAQMAKMGRQADTRYRKYLKKNIKTEKDNLVYQRK